MVGLGVVIIMEVLRGWCVGGSWVTSRLCFDCGLVFALSRGCV